jgi:hypothetical protein
MAIEKLDKLRTSMGISNTTIRDCLQPSNFKKTYRTYMEIIHTGKITSEELCGIFNNTFMRTASTEKAANGYSNTRICRLNPNGFTNRYSLC